MQRGDTLISTVRTYLKAVYFANTDASDLICSTGFAVLTPEAQTVPKYVSYLAQSEPFTRYVSSYSVGTAYPAIAPERLASFQVFVPPTHEQSAIVRFLDHADRRIRRYIRAKQKLIALLEEQRQAIVNRAVTRGHDLDVKLKSSGIGWLGDVPEHWDVVRSKRVFVPRPDLARPDDIQLSATQSYGVIPQAEYEERVGRKVVKVFQHLDKRRHVEIDDFVISMRSFQGGLERAWASGCIRSSYVVLHPAVPVSVDYFGYLFKSRGYIGALQATANFIRDGQDLNYDNFCAVDLPFPPIEEQQQIAAMLSESLLATHSAADRARKEIALLHEYRTRLIADVVTGKLDVREAAARLPDELGDADRALEPLDESEAADDAKDNDEQELTEGEDE
jgi:type I restriction enzyme S subunit